MARFFLKIPLFVIVFPIFCDSQTAWDRMDMTDLHENLQKFAQTEFSAENMAKNLESIMKISQFLPDRIKAALLAGQTSSLEKFEALLATLTDGQITAGCMGDILFFLRAAFSYAHSLQQLGTLDKECPPDAQKNVNCSCLLAFNKEKQEFAWILDVIDSFGKVPSGILEGNFFFLGSYEECFRVSDPRNKYQKNILWEGKYCRADVSTYQSTPSTDQCSAAPNPVTAAAKKPKRDCSNMYKIQYGLCAPKTCTHEDVTTILEIFLAPIKDTVRCNLTVQCHEKLNIAEDGKAIGMVTFVAFVGVLVVFGTLYDYIVYSKLACDLPETKPLNPANKVDSSINITKNEFYSGQTWLVKVLLAFSLYTNIPKIMDVTKKKDQIDCLHGIRVLSMTWVMLGHCYYWSINYLDNLKDAFNLPKHFFNQILLNASMCVDSFYVLSAMLLVYLFFKKMTKVKGKYVTSLPFWGNYILHRYIRLTPAYMIILALDVFLFRYTNDGPLWNQDGIEPNYCRNSWWTNLLYVNNFFQLGELCMSWTWYLANDMQFYVIAPLYLILLWKYEIVGIVAIVTTTIASGVIKAAIILQHDNWPPVSIFTVSPEQFSISDAYWNTLYVKPYIRCKPYLVGMLLGYIMHKYGLKVRLPKWAVFVGWCGAFILGFGVIFGLYDFSKTGYISNAANAIYAIFGRTLWAVALSWVIYACTTGYGGPVNSFLSWKMWLPFSRITYCAYLVHPIMILGFYSSRQRPVNFGTHFQMITYHIAHVIFGYAASFVLSLMFEVPVMGLEQIIFKTGSGSDGTPRKADVEKVQRGFENPNLTRSSSPTRDGAGTSTPITPADPRPPGTVPSMYTPVSGTPIIARTPSTRSFATEQQQQQSPTTS